MLMRHTVILVGPSEVSFAVQDELCVHLALTRGSDWAGIEIAVSLVFVYETRWSRG